MSPLTYKMFNFHFSLRCLTYNLHLHTTLPLNCEPINSSCFPSSESSFICNYLLVLLLLLSSQQNRSSANACLYYRCCFLRNGTDCVRKTSNPRSQLYPSSNQTLIPLLDHEGSQKDCPHLDHNNHTNERHHKYYTRHSFKNGRDDSKKNTSWFRVPHQ